MPRATRPRHLHAPGCCSAPRVAHKAYHAKPEHAFSPGCCAGLPADHRVRPKRKDTRQNRHQLDTRKRRVSDYIIGLDGEGIGRGPHRYVYLAAADGDGETWDLTDRAGLTTLACLEFLLSLPRRAMVVGFSLAYDWTKILADLPDEKLYALFHEKTRQALTPDGKRIIYKSVRWRGFRLNYANKRLTVIRGRQRRTVWDLFKFFQTSFVRACELWKIGAADAATIADMKARRAKFKIRDLDQIAAYCRTECKNLAQLAKALFTAHDDAGIALKTYNGPGSSASVLLTQMGIKEKLGTYPDAMKDALACAFFGGRFENARGGRVDGDVFSADLASAYPYAATGLPCLLHGRWSLVRRPKVAQLRAATLALVHWQGGATRGQWGGLPVRDKRGTIVFPLAAAGGWAWGREYFAAQALAQGGQYTARESWIYKCACDCPPPFAALASYFRERVRVGKNEGPGLAFKLAINSVYGKLAQSKGMAPPFQSWIAAGVITSDTRAELLDVVRSAPDEVFMMATDGVYSRSPVTLRTPRDTGTSDLPEPLGVWEQKKIEGGIFCAQAGVYFPLRSDASTKELRARGIGRAVLTANRDPIMAAHAAGEDHVMIDGFQRFIGAKSAVAVRETDDGETVYKRADNYGDWVPWSVKLSFNPRPKRRAVGRDGRLLVWPKLDFESVPYKPAQGPGPELEAILRQEEIAEEQPDGRLVYEGL